jgi:hypothetical protein
LHDDFEFESLIPGKIFYALDFYPHQFSSDGISKKLSSTRLLFLVIPKLAVAEVAVLKRLSLNKSPDSAKHY